VWRCHYAGACSEACPKGVDPALSIQLLKREIVGRKFKLIKKTETSHVAPILRDVEPNPDIPKPPKRTVT
jgi:succinate dehydrogenase / fumarate reductase iron-sulfur subunit